MRISPLFSASTFPNSPAVEGAVAPKGLGHHLRIPREITSPAAERANVPLQRPGPSVSHRKPLTSDPSSISTFPMVSGEGMPEHEIANCVFRDRPQFQRDSCALPSSRRQRPGRRGRSPRQRIERVAGCGLRGPDEKTPPRWVAGGPPVRRARVNSPFSGRPDIWGAAHGKDHIGCRHGARLRVRQIRRGHACRPEHWLAGLHQALSQRGDRAILACGARSE